MRVCVPLLVCPCTGVRAPLLVLPCTDASRQPGRWPGCLAHGDVPRFRCPRVRRLDYATAGATAGPDLAGPGTAEPRHDLPRELCAAASPYLCCCRVCCRGCASSSAAATCSWSANRAVLLHVSASPPSMSAPAGPPRQCATDTAQLRPHPGPMCSARRRLHILTPFPYARPYLSVVPPPPPGTAAAAAPPPWSSTGMTAAHLHASGRGTPLSIVAPMAADVVTRAALFQSAPSPAADALAVALAVAQAARAGATLLPAGAAAALDAGPSSAAAPDDDLAAALAVAQAACARAAPLSTVLFAPPAVDIAGHAMGVGASSAPPVAAAAPPPPVGAAPLLAGGVPFLCGLGMPPEDAPLAAADFL